MQEYRIIFTDTRGVNIEAESQKEAEEIVKQRDWEHGMDWDEDNIDILSIEEI